MRQSAANAGSGCVQRQTSPRTIIPTPLTHVDLNSKGPTIIIATSRHTAASHHAQIASQHEYTHPSRALTSTRQDPRALQLRQPPAHTLLRADHLRKAALPAGRGQLGPNDHYEQRDQEEGGLAPAAAPPMTSAGPPPSVLLPPRAASRLAEGGRIIFICPPPSSVYFISDSLYNTNRAA